MACFAYWDDEKLRSELWPTKPPHLDAQTRQRARGSRCNEDLYHGTDGYLYMYNNDNVPPRVQEEALSSATSPTQEIGQWTDPCVITHQHT